LKWSSQRATNRTATELRELHHGGEIATRSCALKGDGQTGTSAALRGRGESTHPGYSIRTYGGQRRDLWRQKEERLANRREREPWFVGPARVREDDVVLTVGSRLKWTRARLRRQRRRHELDQLRSGSVGNDELRSAEQRGARRRGRRRAATQ